MTALQALLNTYRNAAQTEREKGTYFEDLIVTYLRNVVNGKSALEWVMERQSVTTHKDSGIKNDANDWAIETMGNARYPLELFQRVITVSLETMKIVAALPKLDKLL